MLVSCAFFLAFVATASRAQTGISSCYTETGLARRCIAQFGNVAEGLRATATNTCGSPASTFCFLTGAGTEACDVCDASDATKRHGAEYLTDPNDNSNPTWWQSRTMNQYPDPDLTANLSLSFGKRYDVTFVNVKFYSPRPKSFAIYASNDFGRTWRAWQYYSSSCTETYGLPNDAGEGIIEDQEAICTDEFSDIVPLSGATVPFSTLQNRRSRARFDTTPALQEWVSATDVSIVLDELNTFRDEAFGSMSAFRRYFYAVQDISVGARCKCNGHASQCIDNENGRLVCDCQHNTTGSDCEQCMPFYYDRPWQRATGDNANECIRCNCNRHADACHFDQLAYDATGSGGVCENCRDNTVGQHCDQCANDYYLPKNGDITKSDACYECKCKVAGTVNGQTTCASGTGQCNCKSQAHGRKCNKCPDEFFNLTASNPNGCEACNCFVAGSVGGNRVCDKVSGQCDCKANVFGRRCDECKDTFYGLSAIDSLGCRACNCGRGSSSSVCNKATGQCTCLPRTSGRDCDEIDDGYFAPTFDFGIMEGEVASGNMTIGSRVEGDGTEFTGRGYAVIPVGGSVTFPSFLVPVGGNYSGYARFILNCPDAQLRLSVTIIPGDQDTAGEDVTECREFTEPTVVTTDILQTGVSFAKFLPDMCLRAGRFYTMDLKVIDVSGSSSCTEIGLDSLFAVPMPSDGRFDSDLIERCVGARMSLSSASGSECESVETTVMTNEIGIQSCGCDSDGSVSFICDKVGGQCQCKPGVGGRTCDQCKPGFYGFSSSGCRRCNCDGKGSASGVCDSTTGQCPCRPGVTGRRCTDCEPNRFGFDSGTGCADCDCNVDGSLGPQCDSQGQCSCRPGVTGQRCHRCQGDHFQLTASGCLPCNCSESGSTSLDCDSTGKCPCKVNAVGRSCDACVTGAFNLKEADAAGCQTCFCYGHSQSCAVAPGYVITQITSSFTDDFDGWTVVNSDGVDVTATVASYRKGKQAIRVQNDDPTAEIFFQAPAKFLGNLRYAYGYPLRVSMTFSANAEEGRLIGAGDVILRSGRDGSRIEARFSTSPTKGISAYDVILGEGGEWSPVGGGDENPNVIAFLENIDALWIRASYASVDARTILLNSVDLRVSREGTSGASADNVESCDCPPGHGGLSCEICLPGWGRLNPSAGAFSPCIPCPCNNHSSACDPETAICIGCRDNTAGDRCEVCAAGFYGNATRGTANDCAACPCPGTAEGESFGATCRLGDDGNVVCGNCSRGHTGRQCEVCLDGFYGDPAGLRGAPTSCEDCGCNGNIDLTATGNCNTETGQCRKCIYNTDGRACQKCRKGFFGNALIRNNCTECNCHPDGVTDDVCRHRTGECFCLDHVTGEDCSRCEDAYYGFGSVEGCRACNCDPTGSETLQCNGATGRCSCKPGVGGEKCDVCLAGFFGFSASGCQACECYEPGSTGLICNNQTGACPCRPGALGRQCDTCELGKHDVAAGCIDCPPCFKQVNASASQLGPLVDRLDRLLKTIRETAIDATDDAFTDALAALQANIDYLLVNATALRQWYHNQLNRLAKWKAEFDQTRRQIQRVEKTAIRSETIANDVGKTNTETGEIVDEIRQILDAMRTIIDGEAQALLEEAKRKSAEQEDQLEELRTLRDTAKNVVENHEEKADNITARAVQALETAREAVKRGTRAVATQREVTEKVAAITTEIVNATALASMTKAAKDAAIIAARDALRRATDVLQRAAKPMEDLGSAKLARDAAYLVGNATRVLNELASVDATNADLIRLVRDARAESAELLQRGKEVALKVDNVVADLYLARMNAAIDDGKMTLDAALDLKSFLDNFDKQMNRTRRNVLRALERAREGKSLISATDDLFTDALAMIADADRDAAAAISVAADAQVKAEGAKRDAESAAQLANEATASAKLLLDDAAKLRSDVAKALDRVDELDKTAQAEKARIGAVLETAQRAANETSAVGRDTTALAAEVKRLLDQLEKNGSLPTDRFNATRRQLEITKKSFEDVRADEIIQDLNEEKTRQETRIKDFQSRLLVIQAEVERLHRINETIPYTCFRPSTKSCDAC